MGPTVLSRHLGSLAAALAGSDDHYDQGLDAGAQRRHPNPSGVGVWECFLVEGDSVETHGICDGLAR